MRFYGFKLIYLLLVCCAMRIPKVQAQVIEGVLPQEGVTSENKDSFFDPSTDYSKIAGRVSDRSDDNKVIKIKFENNNAKFFRSGDPLSFYENNDPRGARVSCKGFVKSTEEYYISVYLPNYDDCKSKQDGVSDRIRIGTQIHIRSDVLLERIVYASQYRSVLLKERKDLLKQLSDVNHFIGSFDQEKINLSAEYDKRILELSKQKQEALDDLLNKKKEQVVIQSELKKELNLLDEKIVYYRIDRKEPLIDRFQTDLLDELPIQKTPQEKIKVESESLKQHRWNKF